MPLYVDLSCAMVMRPPWQVRRCGADVSGGEPTKNDETKTVRMVASVMGDSVGAARTGLCLCPCLPCPSRLSLPLSPLDPTTTTQPLPVPHTTGPIALFALDLPPY